MLGLATEHRFYAKQEDYPPKEYSLERRYNLHGGPLDQKKEKGLERNSGIEKSPGAVENFRALRGIADVSAQLAEVADEVIDAVRGGEDGGAVGADGQIAVRIVFMEGEYAGCTAFVDRAEGQQGVSFSGTICAAGNRKRTNHFPKGFGGGCVGFFAVQGEGNFSGCGGLGMRFVNRKEITSFFSFIYVYDWRKQLCFQKLTESGILCPITPAMAIIVPIILKNLMNQFPSSSTEWTRFFRLEPSSSPMKV